MIYIPTLGRCNDQPTVHAIENTGYQFTLVVQPQEMDAYQVLYGHHNIVELPADIKGIAKTRQWICDNSVHDRIIFMDDDIKFARRINADDWKLRKTISEDIEELIKWIYEQLKEYPVVGVSMRQGNNNHLPSVAYNGQIIRVMGLDLAKMRQHNVRFDAIEFMEDRHVVLSMLEAGYKNIINYEFAQDQASSNAPGGCSGQRTKDGQHAAALKLAELHPGVVKVVTKETKGGWWDGTRTDTICYWKKAYFKGIENVQG